MKILQITPSYKPAYVYGGPTMSVAKLCEALVQQDLNLEVLTTTANGKIELDVESGKKVNVDGVPVTYFKRITKDHTHFSPALLLGLGKKVKEPKLIIHIHSWWNLVTIFSCLVAKMHHIPVVLSPRGMLTAYTKNNRNSFFKSTLHTLIGKSLLKYCHIIASSEQEQQDILQIITPKSITIIPNLVSLPNKQEASPPAGRAGNKEKVGTFKLLFLSRIEEKKGLDILFEALANLNIKWALNIGGEGDEEYVKSLKLKAESLKLSGKIHWLGHINNEDKFDLMANHDLLVLTSHNENFANVVIESLSVGTPVLLSKHVGLSSYVEANDLGFVCDLSSNQITTTLNDAYTNLDTRDRIRLSASQLIKNDFSEDKLTQKYINLYQEILNLKSS